MKGGVSTEREAPRITPFDLHEEFFVLCAQALHDVRMDDHFDLVDRILIFAHDLVE